MSDWDSGQPGYGQHDETRPSWPDGTTYPYPLPFPLAQALDPDDETRPADERRPPGDRRRRGGSRAREAGRDGDQAGPPHPLTYERDNFDRAYEPEPDQFDPSYEEGQFDETLSLPAMSPGGSYVAPPRRFYPWPPAPHPENLGVLTRDKPKSTGSGGGRGRGSAGLEPALADPRRGHRRGRRGGRRRRAADRKPPSEHHGRGRLRHSVGDAQAGDA